MGVGSVYEGSKCVDIWLCEGDLHMGGVHEGSMCVLGAELSLGASVCLSTCLSIHVSVSLLCLSLSFKSSTCQFESYLCGFILIKVSVELLKRDKLQFKVV